MIYQIVGIVLGMMNLDYEQKLKVSNICLSPFIQLMKNECKKKENSNS